MTEPMNEPVNEFSTTEEELREDAQKPKADPQDCTVCSHPPHNGPCPTCGHRAMRTPKEEKEAAAWLKLEEDRLQAKRNRVCRFGDWFQSVNKSVEKSL